MDVLVMIEETPGHSAPLAHVNSVPSPLDSERPQRDVVTLYEVPTPELLALALAAAVEGRRANGDHTDMVRYLGVWPERGAVGDAAWRDRDTGELQSRNVDIPLDRLHARAAQLLADSGQLIRRLIAGLSMPDWPEGARRALTVSLNPVLEITAATKAQLETMLDRLREADGLAFEYEGD